LAKNSAIRTGSQKNTLLVLAKGNDFKIYINGMFLAETNDSNSTSADGLIDFNVGTYAAHPKGDASFANFKVYPLL